MIVDLKIAKSRRGNPDACVTQSERYIIKFEEKSELTKADRQVSYCLIREDSDIK